MESVLYINHLNEVINFEDLGLYITSSPFHNYSWKYDSQYNKISAFYKEITSQTISLAIANHDHKSLIRAVNRLMEYAEKDILGNQAGKIVIGDYYLNCFIYQSKKNSYREREGIITADIDIVSDNPMWTREISRAFRKDDSETTAQLNIGTNLDYPFDFPHDYAPSGNIKLVDNTGFIASDFKMIIYGTCVNPTVFIGDHKYSLNIAVERNERVVIDSKAKTITRINAKGESINEFKTRDKETYVFEKIPSGKSSVTWDGTFGFDVVLYDERSEPIWI